MCETCEFRAVNSFDDAMRFMCRYVLTRFNNLLKLHQHKKYDAFLNTYHLPKIDFRKLFKDLAFVYIHLLDCQSWDTTYEELLKNLELLGFEHVLFGFEKYFPELVRRRIELNMMALKTKEERLNELICNNLYNIDGFV